MPSEDQSQPLAAPEKSLSGIALEAIIRRQEAAANGEMTSAAATNKKDTAASAATNKKDTAAAAVTKEKKAANPFLNMFNDSMFTQELTETMEGGEGEGAHQNILDTSWGLKIEVHELCAHWIRILGPIFAFSRCGPRNSGLHLTVSFLVNLQIRIHKLNKFSITDPVRIRIIYYLRNLRKRSIFYHF